MAVWVISPPFLPNCYSQRCLQERLRRRKPYSGALRFLKHSVGMAGNLERRWSNTWPWKMFMGKPRSWVTGAWEVCLSLYSSCSLCVFTHSSCCYHSHQHLFSNSPSLSPLDCCAGDDVCSLMLQDRNLLIQKHRPCSWQKSVKWNAWF